MTWRKRDARLRPTPANLSYLRAGVRKTHEDNPGTKVHYKTEAQSYVDVTYSGDYG